MVVNHPMMETRWPPWSQRPYRPNPKVQRTGVVGRWRGPKRSVPAPSTDCGRLIISSLIERAAFKLSRDVKFLEKLTDVVGLYLNPPDRSLVLCIDEKSQIQALDRTQPGLPLKQGRCGTFTHDYVRHGTTTLFAALEILEGKVIGQCFPRHRHQEFLRFLRRLDDEFPENLKLHLVLDNYGTHKHPKVEAWLQRHPRFTVHFIPTSSSWLNQVERWFGELTQKAVRRGTFISVAELQSVIEQFLQAWNEAPRPFVWTATVEKIMAKIERARQKLDEIKPGWSQRRKSGKSGDNMSSHLRHTTLALRADGGVATWGQAANVPPALTDAVALRAEIRQFLGCRPTALLSPGDRLRRLGRDKCAAGPEQCRVLGSRGYAGTGLEIRRNGGWMGSIWDQFEGDVAETNVLPNLTNAVAIGAHFPCAGRAG